MGRVARTLLFVGCRPLLKAKSRDELGLVTPVGWDTLPDEPMNFPHFVRIDRERRGQDRHFVVHTHDPKFTVEFTPDVAAPDHVGQGVIKRICVPNSWAGDYGRYAKLLSAAQEFFVQSKAEPNRRA
jgi:hypothetical protein